MGLGRVLVVDDEADIRKSVRMILTKAGYDVIEAEDGEKGIAAVKSGDNPLLLNTIICDLQMPKINGFEMLELLDERPAVIFTTAFDEYAIRAFEAHAIDYLLKPFNQERFDKAIQKWRDQAGGAQKNTNELLETASQSPSQSQRVVVKTGSKIKIIPAQDIFFLEAADDYVKVHTQEGSFLKNKTMNHFEKTLDPQQFVRSHRSYIVNVQQITRIDPYEKDNHIAILKSGGRVPVSRNGYAKLRAVLGL